MEFPLTGLIDANVSDPATTVGRESLYSRQPIVAVPYVVVLGVAAIVGTLGNLIVVTSVTVKYCRSQRRRAKTTSNDAGRAFIANLALSDLIVTAVINPLAIAGNSHSLLHFTHIRIGTRTFFIPGRVPKRYKSCCCYSSSSSSSSFSYEI